MMLGAPVPFVAFPNVSFQNYALWMRFTVGNGLLPHSLFENIQWAAYLFLPLTLCLVAPPTTGRGRVERWWVSTGFAAGVIAVVVAASTPGAGAYHLVPFLPALIFLIAPCVGTIPDTVRRSPLMRAGGQAFIVTVLLVALVQQWYFIDGTTLTRGLRVGADLERVMDANPSSTIAMGVSDAHEAYTFARPLLVFRGEPYPLDGPAVQEAQLSGLPLPAATFDNIRMCGIGIWLLPKGGAPFALPSKYRILGYPPLFSNEFRQTFAQAYQHTGDTDYFEVWRCRERG